MMDIDEMPASDEPDVLRKMVALVGELLDCLPDNSKWDNRVALVRRKAIRLLLEVLEAEKAQGGGNWGQVNIGRMPAGR